MKDNSQHGEYLAPKVKVIEIKSQRVLCKSGNTEKYTNPEIPWDW